LAILGKTDTPEIVKTAKNVGRFLVPLALRQAKNEQSHHNYGINKKTVK